MSTRFAEKMKDTGGGVRIQLRIVHDKERLDSIVVAPVPFALS